MLSKSKDDLKDAQMASKSLRADKDRLEAELSSIKNSGADNRDIMA